MQGEVVDVLAPVSSSTGELLGFVRVSSRYATIVDELLQLRYVIGFVTVIGLVLGGVVGSALAINIGNPVQQITQAVLHLTRGEKKESIAENGPEEIRLLIHAVNGLVERLRSLEQSRQQLLANLIHELGRPLGSLRMAVQVLLYGSKEDPAQLDELLHGMDLEMENLQRLLDDLAHLHEQVLGPLELNLQKISLSQWLPTILRPWEEAARQKDVSGLCCCPQFARSPPGPNRFSQIIGNQSSNAIKFHAYWGRIDLTAGIEADKLWVRVSDSGSGIAIDEQENIFKPFYRGQKTRLSEGMGLGLSITRDLVQAHQGTVIVESEPGKGSRFTIFLPLEHGLSS
jgi:signal transduction histidine kinase